MAMTQKYVAWFSCGAASAVAAKLALLEYSDLEIVYQDTGAEHPDNKRFLSDCEDWFGAEIRVIKSKEFKFDSCLLFNKTNTTVISPCQ